MVIKKLTFEEAWDTSTIFYVDDALENEIDQKVKSLLETAEDTRITYGIPIDERSVKEFLIQQELGLDVMSGQRSSFQLAIAAPARASLG